MAKFVCTIRPDQLELLKRLAVETYPNEACALLVGGETRIDDVVPAQNVDPSPRDTFEVDPVTLLRTHREAREAGQAVIGVFHTHPDHPARPSTRDLARAVEPGQIWIIASVTGETVTEISAFQLMEQPKRFEPVSITIS